MQDLCSGDFAEEQLGAELGGAPSWKENRFSVRFLCLQSVTGVFRRTGPCNTTPTAPNPSVAGFANFRLQQNNKVFRSAVYHRPRAVTWTALGCHATSWVWNIPPPLATWLPVSHTGQSCQEWSQKGLKEEPSGEVCPEVSLHSPVGYIIDEHTINFLTK